MPQLVFDPQPAEGFFGVWYRNGPGHQAAPFKYSGGLATYPQQHRPIAIHRADVGRTYFAWGASRSIPTLEESMRHGQPGHTIDAISYYDHATGTLAPPLHLVTRDWLDPHENPTIAIDDAGHVLMFCPGHGESRESCIVRTARPHDLTSFEMVRRFGPSEGFAYPQPWWVAGRGLVLLHTRYEGGERRLAATSSPDGVDWSRWDEPTWVSRMAAGSYQISWADDAGRVATCFDVHPTDRGDMPPLNYRRNIYYLETRDLGRTWRSAEGERFDVPAVDEDNDAQMLSTRERAWNVYLKDLCFDDRGEPIVVYLTCGGPEPGPEHGPHQWWIATRDAAAWTHTKITRSDHAYDHGELFQLVPDDWRLFAPTGVCIDRWGTGGQMHLWQSRDRGQTWADLGPKTDDQQSYTYARRPHHAQRDFAWLFSDGRANTPSPSTLHFADSDGHMIMAPRTHA